MMQMLRGSGSRRPNNPIAMMAANMTPQRAQQQVEKLLADGTMSQDQFQQLQQQAKDFMAFLGK